MMNKQELIRRLKEAITEPALNDYQRVENIALTYALGLVEELEKPVVPQFVADWYEEHKDNFEIFLSGLCINFTCHRERLNDKLANWYEQLENKPIETLVKMKLFGYEVEKEKLYTVEIPNHDYPDKGKFVLCKNKSGKVFIKWTCLDDWEFLEEFQLTEEEVKEKFDWALQFKKEVNNND